MAQKSYEKSWYRKQYKNYKNEPYTTVTFGGHVYSTVVETKYVEYALGKMLSQACHCNLPSLGAALYSCRVGRKTTERSARPRRVQNTKNAPPPRDIFQVVGEVFQNGEYMPGKEVKKKEKRKKLKESVPL